MGISRGFVPIIVILLSLSCTLLVAGCAPLTPPEDCPYAVSSPVIDIDALLATTPDFSYDFEDGWNAVNMVMQFSWIDGAGEPYDTNTQKKAHLYGEFGATPTEEEIWSFDVYYPASGMEPDSEGEILVQFHGVPDPGEASREPPIGMHNKNNRITLVWRYDYRRITPAGFNNWDERVVDFGATPKNRWVNYVFHIRFDPEGCGLIRVWEDGLLKVERVGIPIGYNDSQGAYLGFGIYKWSNDSSVATERRVLFDDIEMWRVLY